MSVQLSSTVPPDRTLLVKYVALPDWYEEAYDIFNYILNVLQFVGFFINILHMSILTRPALRSCAIYRLMIGICSCDIWTHIFTFLIFSPFLIRSSHAPEKSCFITLDYFDAWMERYGIVVLDSTQRASTWLALSMAVYRTLSILFPMSTRVQKMSRPRVSVYTVLVVLLVSFGWGWEVMSRKVITPRAIEQGCDGTVIELNVTRYLVLVPSHLSPAHNKIIMIYGFIKALPSLIDPILTVILIMELWKASKRRERCGKTDCEKTSTTKLILFMTISGFVLEVPNGFSHIISGVFFGYKYIATIALLIEVFAEILPVVNSSSHLFICLLMSSLYRDTAKGIFCVSKGKKNIIFVEHTSTSKHSHLMKY